MTADILALISLFSAAFSAATILPMQSEAVLSGMLLAGVATPATLVAVASIGNILGSAVNWAIGRGIERFRHRKWFPVSEKSLTRAQDWYARYGRWALLLSWMPLIGDAITVAAGVMRENFAVFIVFVTIAKTARYIVLAAVVLKAF